MRAIAARFTDKSVKLDTEKRRVLTTLKMIYEGGSLDGKTAYVTPDDLVGKQGIAGAAGWTPNPRSDGCP